MILVDTPLWSLALRRKTSDLASEERLLTASLSELVKQHRVRLLGSIRQEVLSGIREESQFLRLREHLRDFSDVQVGENDYEEAARASNRCRKAGIANTSVDMLLCAVALRHDWEVFTTDRDFDNYGAVLKVRLFAPR